MRWPFKRSRGGRDVESVFPRLRRIAIERGVMRRPEIDWERSLLVEGELRLDLLNVYHTSRQLEHPERERVLSAWLAPAHLGQACYYARLDVVKQRLAEGDDPSRLPNGGSPIDAAEEAWVVTPLHVECVCALLDAGARLTPKSFGLHPEAMGSEEDFDLLDVLVEYGLRDADPAVRVAAETAKNDGLRTHFRQMRERRKS